MRLVQALAAAIVLAASPVPAVAQAEATVCLHVQAAPDMDLTDPSAVEAGISSGEILVTDVIPCDAVAPAAGSTAPAASMAPAESTAPASDIGAWTVGSIEVDPVTKARSAQATLVAASGTVWYGDPYTLTIACDGAVTELTVSWLWQLGTEDLIDVDTKVGEDEFTREPWFNDGQATRYGRSDVNFIESLYGQTRLTLQVQVPDAGLAIAEFDITGIEDAVANVRETCDW